MGRRAHEKEPAGWQTPRSESCEGYAVFAFFALWVALRAALFMCFAFSFAANSCLTLRRDGVHVHLVGGGGVAEHLRGILPCGRHAGWSIRPASRQRALLGTAQVGGEQLPDGVAVLRFLDAALTGDDLQTVFVQQRGICSTMKSRSRFIKRTGTAATMAARMRMPVALRQCLFAAALLLLRFEFGIGLGWVASWGDGRGNRAGCKPSVVRPCRMPSATMASVVYLHVLNSGHFAFSVVSGFSGLISTYLLRGNLAAFLLLAVGRADLH